MQLFRPQIIQIEKSRKEESTYAKTQIYSPKPK
jgi:hypothetical protein